MENRLPRVYSPGAKYNCPLVPMLCVGTHAELVLSVAGGKTPKSAVAEFFRGNSDKV